MLHHTRTLPCAIALLYATASLRAEEAVKYPPSVGNEGGIVTAEVSCGELVDKITILEIKSSKFAGTKKKNVDTELETLNETRRIYLPNNEEIYQLTNKLRETNHKLWNIEDDIRAKERDKEFDNRFIQLARSVYFTNDVRGDLKRAINNLCGSRLVEEKQYTEYKDPTPTTPTGDMHLTATEHLEKGVAAFRARNKEEALFHLQAAQKLEPANARAIAMQGMVYQAANEYEASLGCYQHLFRYAPNNPVLADHMAHNLKMLGHADELIPLEELVHRARPSKNTTMRCFMAYARTMRWKEAEEVLKGSIFSLDHYWRGYGDIGEKRILVPMHYKMGCSGFGDVFQFTRYAKRLKEAGAHVIVQISNNKLRPILSLCPFIDQIVTEDEETPLHDLRYPLCATAMILCFKDEVDQPSRDAPYLHADEKLVAHWHNKMAGDNKFKIGIFWQRGQTRDYFSGQLGPCSRGMKLAQLAPLATIPGISFYSLQKGLSDEVTQLPAGFVVNQFNPDEFDAAHGSFMDSAAVIKQMDLVITIDSSIAHLAGALGVPVWTMLPTSSCYRWFVDRTDSPWYPTMRLFRQQRAGDWSTVIDEIRSALSQLKSS